MCQMSKRTKCQVSIVFYTRDIGFYHIQSKPIPSIIKKNEINNYRIYTAEPEVIYRGKI